VRLSHPYVWVVGMIGLGLALLAVVVHKVWRALSWPAEQRRRQTWPMSVARVVEGTRLTDAGDYLLTLEVADAAPTETYRSAPARARLRGVARLPAAAVAWMEDAGELPVRVLLPGLVVDLHVIMGAQADAFERDSYRKRGTPTWKAVSIPAEEATADPPASTANVSSTSSTRT
jgi:hypothetical protein